MKVRCVNQAIQAATGLIFVVLAIGWFADGRSSFVNVLLFVSGIVFIAHAARTPLEIGASEVVIRRSFRAREIPRSDIVATETGETGPWPRWTYLVLRLADGSTVDLERLSQLRDGGAVDRARALLAA